MILAKNLSKSFGDVKVLDSLELHVKEGSVYGLLGPNGAGKTTLIKHLVGIMKEDCGTVLVDNQKIFECPTLKSSMVYIADDLFFFSQYSIFELAKFYASIYDSWSWERFELLKEVFPIDVKRRAIKLSKGMQKQVAFWLAISVMPKIMILDEPVDGLDPVMRKKVWNLIMQDVAERNTTVLVSSHNLRELEDICDHIGILYNGKIVVERDLEDMKSDIHKVQIAFNSEEPENLNNHFTVLHRSQLGSVISLILKGGIEDIMPKLKALEPSILDIIPLTLEEIFIYELGGLGYEIKDIII